MVIYCVMPMLWDDMASYQTWIFMAGICWCIAETTRYPFYQFKSLQPILGHLRYNLFIVCYPIGVTGELLCFYGALLLVLWCFDSLFILSRWATAEALWHFSTCRVYAPVFGIEKCCT